MELIQEVDWMFLMFYCIYDTKSSSSTGQGERTRGRDEQREDGRGREGRRAERTGGKGRGGKGDSR